MSSNFAFTQVVVGPPGKWKVVTTKSKKKEEKFEQRELRAPVDWAHYTLNGYRLSTNAQYVKRVWRKPAGESGPGVEEPEKVIHPWVSDDSDGRLDLKITLTGVEHGKQVFWHDALWYFFCNDGRYTSLPSSAKVLNGRYGFRGDHVGGLPEVTGVGRLQLIDAAESARQGSQRKRLYRMHGERSLMQRRLFQRPLTVAQKKPSGAPAAPRVLKILKRPSRVIKKKPSQPN